MKSRKSIAAGIVAGLAASSFWHHAMLASAAIPSNLKTVTHLTEPLPLRPGEVTNSYHRLPVPPGPIAIYEFAADVVEKDADGNIVPVPLKDAYLHHHVVISEHEAHAKQKKHWWPMRPKKRLTASRGVGFGAGTESRGTPQKFYYPYAFTTVEGEDEFIANVHVINTRSMSSGDAHHCLECPCTSVDLFESNSTILGSVASRKTDGWDTCNNALVEEGNTACRPDTYYGGLLCCEDGEFCLDDYDNSSAHFDNDKASGPISTYYLRYTVRYADATKDNRPLYLASCCDASGNETMSGNIEYDIPQLCEEWDSLDEDGDDCIHEVSTIQSLHGSSDIAFGAGELNEDEEAREVELVYMVGHLHRGGIDMVATDANTGELICKSVPNYGTGNDIGNEKGYINGMSTCVFDPPRRMMTTDPIRVTSRYDARSAHTGVMGLFYIAVADLEDEHDQHLGRAASIMQWAGVGAIIACAIVVARKIAGHVKRRKDYEMVPPTVFTANV